MHQPFSSFFFFLIFHESHQKIYCYQKKIKKTQLSDAMTKSLPQNSYLRPLNADDLDQVVQLEALMPQSQLSTPDLV